MTKYVFTSGAPYRAAEHHDVAETYDFGGDGALRLADGADADPGAPGVQHVEHETIFEHRVADLAVEEDSPIATLREVEHVGNVPKTGATGDGVHVALVDSGVDTSHPAFEGVTVNQVDVTGTGTGDAVGHGTASAGQIARIAPDVELTMIKVFPDKGRTTSKYVLRAYQWLLNNASDIDAVNMSWGAGKDVRSINRLHTRLVSQGVRDTTAAGNTGAKGGSPATADRAFAVGACTDDATMAEFSSYNPRENPEVVAVGKYARLARADNSQFGYPQTPDWTVASGTSFSAPAVAGMVARYLERHPDTDPKRVREDFVKHARNLEGTERDRHGIADYAATVQGSSDSKNGDSGGDKNGDGQTGSGGKSSGDSGQSGSGDGRTGTQWDRTVRFENASGELRLDEQKQN
ncbi:S8 family peptidase [Halarchaeum sp. P4]|uniref:S8 family peptidase n=1 Tax=Halarchaeum sp. P4 TaxID=3421639 RepID=UPI003EC14B14